MIEILLLATDFSRRSEIALDRALLLVKRAAERIGFLHVIDPEVSVALVRGEQSMTPPAMEELLMARLAPGAPRPDLLVRKGDPYEEIIAAADAREDDLIVMGSPRPRKFLERLRGTTLERVIRASSRPVLSVRGPAPTPYKCILVTSDMSETSALALRTAKRLGLLDGARVFVVHALWPQTPYMVDYNGMTIDVMLNEAADETGRTLIQLRDFVQGLDLGLGRAECLVVEGTPQVALRKVVSEVKPDLVVLGTQGRSGVLRLVLGSVAEDLLSWMPVDVLAVPPGEHS